MGNYIVVSLAYIFETKLKLVKVELKLWAKKYYTKPDNERQSMENELANLYKNMET